MISSPMIARSKLIPRIHALMASLLIRDLPEDLHAELKLRAAQNRRSLSKEVLVLLEMALSLPERPLEPPEPIDLGVPLTEEWLSWAKREGRA